jgi:3-(3-hydroxy-phenyl)propionate hydroxylase
VLGLTGEPSEFLSSATIERLAEVGSLLVRVSPPPVGRRGSGVGSGVERPQEQVKADRIEIHDIDGAFRDLRLDRPEDEVIILRPDRYVAAACRTADLDSVVGDLCSILRG